MGAVVDHSRTSFSHLNVIDTRLNWREQCLANLRPTE